MNTDITASVKPEYPVVDRNPAFTKVVGNFSALDYMRLSTISAVSVTVGYLSGIAGDPRAVNGDGGLIGVLGGFMYAYQNSAGRLMGFFPTNPRSRATSTSCSGRRRHRFSPFLYRKCCIFPFIFLI
ncbi:hypothetical protein ZWY2020_028791 [Hordeum vulgare]|nr:hypothetical protein ZWY2020_028791 [Hordeum vulgare]